MNEKQKVLKLQIQLAGIGILIFGFGIFEKYKPCIIIGICIFIYACIRFVFLKKLMNHLDN
ncbi:MAG: hypothetical protein ACI4UK_08095 [Floccifex sp.]